MENVRLCDIGSGDKVFGGPGFLSFRDEEKKEDTEGKKQVVQEITDADLIWSLAIPVAKFLW